MLSGTAFSSSPTKGPAEYPISTNINLHSDPDTLSNKDGQDGQDAHGVIASSVQAKNPIMSPNSTEMMMLTNEVPYHNELNITDHLGRRRLSQNQQYHTQQENLANKKQHLLKNHRSSHKNSRVGVVKRKSMSDCLAPASSKSKSKA